MLEWECTEYFQKKDLFSYVQVYLESPMETIENDKAWVP